MLDRRAGRIRLQRGRLCAPHDRLPGSRHDYLIGRLRSGARCTRHDRLRERPVPVCNRLARYEGATWSPDRHFSCMWWAEAQTETQPAQNIFLTRYIKRTCLSYKPLGAPWQPSAPRSARRPDKPNLISASSAFHSRSDFHCPPRRYALVAWDGFRRAHRAPGSRRSCNPYLRVVA
jgi:hypothetical protein